ncbi:hypothetical protein CAEBREN_05848 [Caenorhabditis brenneri]|uniref:Uncharacterized protein n=1 Tax=Caenorhabditis brenneri TaxID=135651 RepID=G0NBY7_CAEBE|nr:hypothetical protein CAEBREN_05848 [Caenorhabditis brenneri]
MKTILIILFLAVGTTFGFPPWFQVCRVDTDCILVKDLGRIGKCIQGECITDYLDRFQAKPRGFLPECIYDKDCPRKEQKCFANHCGFSDDSKRRLAMCNMDENGECTCAQDSDCPAGGWCNNQGVCLGWEEFAAGGL